MIGSKANRRPGQLQHCVCPALKHMLLHKASIPKAKFYKLPKVGRARLDLGPLEARLPAPISDCQHSANREITWGLVIQSGSNQSVFGIITSGTLCAQELPRDLFTM